jgi:hypothetical protein
VRIIRVLLAGTLFAIALPAFSQTEAGVVVHGVFSSQPSFVAITCVIPCPVTATHVNNGVAIEGFVSRSIVNVHVASLSLELPLVDIPNRGTNLNASFSTFALTPGVRLSFLPHSGVSPFLSAGGGFAHFSGDMPSATKGAVLTGGGIDFKTRVPLIGIRVEAKDLLTPWPSLVRGSGVMNNVLVGGGLVLRF